VKRCTNQPRSPGQRYDIIINATQPSGNYWFRVGTGGRCDGPNANAANIGSIFRYAGAPTTQPNSTAAGPLPVGCYDEPNIVPWVNTVVPQDTPKELELGFTNTAGSGNLVQWLVNGVAMEMDLDHPTLQSVADGNRTFQNGRHVFQVGEKHKVRIFLFSLSCLHSARHIWNDVI
jgi:hypothetical protein